MIKIDNFYIPKEVMQMTFEYLPPSSLGGASRVCKAFNNALDDNFYKKYFDIILANQDRYNFAQLCRQCKSFQRQGTSKMNKIKSDSLFNLVLFFYLFPYLKEKEYPWSRFRNTKKDTIILHTDFKNFLNTTDYLQVDMARFWQNANKIGIISPLRLAQASEFFTTLIEKEKDFWNDYLKLPSEWKNLKSRDFTVLVEPFHKTGVASATFLKGMECIDTDINYAKKLFKEAAEKGSIAARIELSKWVSTSESITLLEPIALEGHLEAKFRLAKCFLESNDDKISDKGFALLQEVAQQGHAEAQYQLGCRLMEKAELNQRIANQKFAKASMVSYDSSRHTVHQGIMGCIEKLVITLFKGYILCKKVAEQVYVDAQIHRGALHMDEAKHMQQQAHQWYLKAARQIHGKACRPLGDLFMKGIGCKKNEAEAAYWFFQAVMNSEGMYSAQASYKLGECYKNGKGVPTDLDKANEWFSKSDQI